MYEYAKILYSCNMYTIVLCLSTSIKFLNGVIRDISRLDCYTWYHSNSILDPISRCRVILNLNPLSKTQEIRVSGISTG